MGGLLLFILFLIPVAMVGYAVIRYIKAQKIVSNEQMFRQLGVTVEFDKGEITIGKYRYPVSKVTGIKMTYQNSGRHSHLVRIEVDDFKKPVHSIVVVGREQAADEFAQRISVALRKAGGPSFT